MKFKKSLYFSLPLTLLSLLIAGCGELYRESPQVNKLRGNDVISGRDSYAATGDNSKVTVNHNTTQNNTTTHNNHSTIQYQRDIPLSVYGENTGEEKAKTTISVLKQNIQTESGEQLSVELVILNQDYKWAYGSWTRIENNTQTQSFTPQEYARSLRENRFSGYDYPVVGIGLASHEGAEGSEEARAGQRAASLMEACSDVFHSRRRYKLNLGQHEETTLDKTFSSNERRVVLLYVKFDKPVEIDELDPLMEEAVQRGIIESLDGCRNLDFDPNKYSNFKKKNLKVIPLG